MAKILLKRVFGLVFAIVVLLAVSCIGCYGGFSFSDFTLANTPEWRMLGSPPEKIEKLIAIDFSTIYVETVSGNLYSCYWSSPYDNKCWVSEKKVPELSPCACTDLEPPITPKPPSGKVIEELTYECCGSFAGNTDYTLFAYYLMDDGTVYQWGTDYHRIISAPGLTIRLLKNIVIFWFLGGFMGSAFAMLIVVYAFKEKMKQP